MATAMPEFPLPARSLAWRGWPPVTVAGPRRTAPAGSRSCSAERYAARAERDEQLQHRSGG